MAIGEGAFVMPRFRRSQVRRPVEPDQGVPDRERTGGQVDVVPAQCQKLALAKAEADGERVQRLIAPATDRLQESLPISDRPGFGRVASRGGRHDEVSDVARHDLRALRGTEGCPQHRVGSACAAGSVDLADISEDMPTARAATSC